MSVGFVHGSNRVNRGGSWNNEPRNCRSANRNRNEPDNRRNNLGFRVAGAAAQRERRMPPLEPDRIPSPATGQTRQAGRGW
jgi:hypothetical protein